MLRVNEIFDTIQGEGRFTGTPATFIRLQGCDVACPWCDTKYTWPSIEKHKISVEEMVAKESAATTWAAMDPMQLAHMVTLRGLKHFVITGGEPAAQDIEELCSALSKAGTVQIETSGTYEISVPRGAWVTVSPKIEMAGGRKMLDQPIKRANEIKMPVASESDLASLFAITQDTNAEIWLQPVDAKPENVSLCVAACLQHGFKLSIQTHRLAGIR